MDFRQTIECKLVAFQHRKETDRDGRPMEWTTLDFLRSDGSGVIQTTIGPRALNGTDLKKGGSYRVTFKPKALRQGDRAIISTKPQIESIESA